MPRARAPQGRARARGAPARAAGLQPVRLDEGHGAAARRARVVLDDAVLGAPTPPPQGVLFEGHHGEGRVPGSGHAVVKGEPAAGQGVLVALDGALAGATGRAGQKATQLVVVHPGRPRPGRRAPGQGALLELHSQARKRASSTTRGAVGGLLGPIHPAARLRVGLLLPPAPLLSQLAEGDDAVLTGVLAWAIACGHTLRTTQRPRRAPTPLAGPPFRPPCGRRGVVAPHGGGGTLNRGERRPVPTVLLVPTPNRSRAKTESRPWPTPNPPRRTNGSPRRRGPRRATRTRARSTTSSSNTGATSPDQGRPPSSRAQTGLN